MKSLKKFLLVTEKGAQRVSWMKLGAVVCGAVGAVVTAGVCPPALLPYAKAVLAVGGAVGLVGARDALKKED